jgi:hypothetical protein
VSTPLTPAELRSTVLKAIASNPGITLGRWNEPLTETVKEVLGNERRAGGFELMEAVWSLIGQGLVYIDFSQPTVSNWRLALTRAGEAAALDEAINPDDAHRYLQHLRSLIPGISDVVMMYAREALSTYQGRNYLASAVMLGVASEAAFLELAEAFGKWLPSAQAAKSGPYFFGRPRRLVVPGGGWHNSRVADLR